MEYKQITNILSDLNKTTKLDKITHKRFIKNITTSYDNFNNLLNGMLQTFTLNGIYLVSETHNVNLDKKIVIYNSNINDNGDNYNVNNDNVDKVNSSDVNNIKTSDINNSIINLFTKYNTPQFLNTFINKTEFSKENTPNIMYYNEIINNINTIENWYIMDIKHNNMDDVYKKKQYIPIMDYEYKYVMLTFIDYKTGLEWELRINPSTFQTDIVDQSFKLMIIANYKLSSKSNVIQKQITNLVSVLKNIDGVIFCL
jgi:hypothetical protein